MTIIHAIFLFILAGIAEIGGGYLIWLWLREGKPLYWGLGGGAALALYGVIAAFQSFPSFGEFMQPMVECLSFYLFYGDGGSIRKRRIYMIGLVQVYA